MLDLVTDIRRTKEVNEALYTVFDFLFLGIFLFTLTLDKGSVKVFWQKRVDK